MFCPQSLITGSSFICSGEGREDSLLSSNLSDDHPLQRLAASDLRAPTSFARHFLAGMSLEEFLDQSDIGKSVKDIYSRQGFLDDSSRSYMVRLLIEEVSRRHECFTASMADDLASDIVSLFPAENKSVYYYPAPAYNKNAGGKLLVRYRNVKRKCSGGRKEKLV